MGLRQSPVEVLVSDHRKVEFMTNKRKVSLTIVFGITFAILIAIFFSPLQAVAWHCAHGNHIDLGGTRLALPLLWWPKNNDGKGTVEIDHAKAGQISFLEGLEITPLSPDKIKSRDEFLDSWNKISARFASGHIKTLRPAKLQTRDFTLYCMRNTIEDEIVVCWSPDLPWSIGYMGLHRSAKEAESIISTLEKSR
jgi:hypothetical protein